MASLIHSPQAIRCPSNKWYPRKDSRKKKGKSKIFRGRRKMVFLNCQSFTVSRSLSVWTAITNSINKAEAESTIVTDFGKLLGKKKLNLKESSTINPSYCRHLLQALSKERSLLGGIQIHAHLIKTGLQSYPPLQTCIFNLYLKCESMELARKVFDTCNCKTGIVSWNSMISLYSKFRLVHEAFSLFLELLSDGLEPDQFTFSTIIRLLQHQKLPSLQRQFHSLAIRSGYGEEEFVVSSLVQMYSAWGNVSDSVNVFMKSAKYFTAAAWNSIIAGLVEHGCHARALELYEQMLQNGTKPTPLTFSSLLKSSSYTKELKIGEQIHSQMIVCGFSSNVILETALVDFYSKCGDIGRGRRIFERMDERNVVTWNSMIRGCSQLGCNNEAMQLFGTMRREDNIIPDNFTFPALLTAVKYCHGDVESIHAYILKVGLEKDRYIGTSLITAYSTKNDLKSAILAFQDTDSNDIGVWSSMITANLKTDDQGEDAVKLFIDMLNSGVQPNQFVYSSLLMTSGGLSMLGTGKQIHAHSLKSIEAVDTATNNSLINMYSSSGYIQESWRVFNSIENPNVISFNSMISAVAQHGSLQDAVKLFKQMEVFDLRPDGITIVNLLTAFNHAGDVDNGLELFNSMEEKHQIKPTYEHCACVVDMLCRAGEIEEALRFIYEMPVEPSSSVWRIVLGACSKHRNLEVGKKVAELLLELEPYEATNYLLLANNYARTGDWLEADKVRHLLKEKGIAKEVGLSWIEVNKAVYTFKVADRSHPFSEQIHARLHELIKAIRRNGYVPDISFTLHVMGDDSREESLYYHTEKMAFAFGDICTAQGATLRIMKNLRVCGDCHCAFKHFSIVTGREIILKDNYRFHHFINGQCSCKDFW